jgi:hypothetical protein
LDQEKVTDLFGQIKKKIAVGQNLILHTVPNYLLLQSLIMVAIAQLVRASDCGSEGRGFEPHWLPQKLKPSAFRRFFIFILSTIHQKALLKGI